MKPIILNYTENSAYAPLNGSFSLAWIDKKLKTVESRDTEDTEMKRYLGKFWFSCLEQFNNVFQEDCKSILFCHPGDHTKLVSDLMNKVESLLEIPEKEKSLFFETDEETITAIRPAAFWLNDCMRRKMFVLFVRASLYYQSSFMGVIDTLKKYPLANKCIPMFEVFLDSYTNFHKNILDYWKADFHNGLIYYFTKVKPGMTKENIIELKLLTK